MAAADRPREKLISQGVSALSNTELIALLLGSGTAAMPIMNLAGKLVSVADNDVARLHTMSIVQLCRVKGIGKVRAGTLKAALELGRRLKYPDLG
ncbi:MAG: repair protein RadC [Mucilaginibacter sp.]|nr:repair protein RadC [Mucilaginibacter sp.]